jgi:type IV pilus assembly protein PilP
LNNRPSQQRRENLSPLQRYEVGQLKLVGVIWDVKEPNAMVEDSAGLGYVVRIGTPIGSNEGKVKAIQPAKIVIEEFEIDLYGAKKKIERTMRLAPEKAE